MDRYENLVGKPFRRNKYGLSDWIQRVKKVSVVQDMNSDKPYEVWIYGDGQNIFPYSISEIQFI